MKRRLGLHGTVVAESPGEFALARVDTTDGRLEVLARPDSARGERGFDWPRVLRGGRAALFNIQRGGGTLDSLTVGAIRLTDGTITRLNIYCLNPRCAASGHLICARIHRCKPRAKRRIRDDRGAEPGLGVAPVAAEAVMRGYAGGGSLAFGITKR